MGAVQSQTTLETEADDLTLSYSHERSGQHIGPVPVLEDAC